MARSVADIDAEIDRLQKEKREAIKGQVDGKKRELAAAADWLHEVGELHPEIERVFTDKRGVFSPYRVLKVGKGD